MKKLTVLFLLFASIVGHAQSLKQADELSRPWTFWYWMYGAVSAEGIRDDLQAMKDAGLGGCYLMPIRGVEEKPEYQGTAQQLSVPFWQMVELALQQADSLGLQMRIHICDGFALAGGPWITPEESMQKVVWSDTLVVVPNRQQQSFNLPFIQGYDDYYEDIAAFAVRAEVPLPKPNISGTIERDENGTFRSREAGYIQFSFDEPQTVRSLEVIPSGNNLQAQRLLVQASDDGVTFRNVRQLVPPRQGWQNTDCNYTFSLPATTARHFRFYWTPDGTEPGSEDLDAGKWTPTLKIKDLRLSADACIDQYEGKSGAVWRISADEIEDFDISDSSENPIPFTPGVTQLPAGRWRILRFGHTSTGHTNATAGGARGLECDKFSAAAVEKQIENWFGEFMLLPHHEVIRYMHVDSWECGCQNWSQNFAHEFHRRRGYDLLPFLPVFAGVPMKGGEQVLRDVRQTINDLINDVFFVTVKRCADRFGVQLSAESVAPTMVADGMRHYKTIDFPMGEFWLNSPTHDKPNDMLDAISAAHVYGKNVVQAEAFTEVRGVWNETPAMIKPLLDRNFALGMNRLFFHVFTHNPWMDKKPGMTLDGIGLFFQRDQTWFPEARGLVDYITRCQTILQMGKPVVDIAVFTGEEIPCRAFTPDKVVPMLPGLFGAERVAAEQKRLANVGQPMEESPVGVRHSAGILDLKDWINPLHGYQYDSMNKDALLSQPCNYKVLVIPQGIQVSKEVQEKVAQLRQQGVTIIDKPFHASTFETVAPDVVLPEGIAYTHRQHDLFNIYFLSNQTNTKQCFTAKFRDTDEVATVYRPEQNKYTWTTHNDGALELEMAPFESVFVVFGYRWNCIATALVKETFGKLLREELFHSVEDIPNEKLHSIVVSSLPTWDITFRESGIVLKSQPLFDWSQYKDDKIRYYSGHARYTTTLTLKAKEVPKKRTWLSLPNVKDIAHVWINGRDCGIVWTDPYEVEITKTLKKGDNIIEIEVVNTWHNALRGADAGKSPYEGIWTNAKYRTKGDDLLPAGLLGPLVLKTEKDK